MTNNTTDTTPDGQQGEQPQCVAAISTELSADAAVGEVADEIDAAFGGEAPDLVFMFATHHYGGDLARLGAEVVEATGTAGLAGCTGGWAVGGGREEEHSPGLSVLAASLPGTKIAVGSLPMPADGGAETLEFPLPLTDESSVIVFADPYTFPTTAWLASFADDHPGVPLVGGIASGGVAPGQNVLFAGSEPISSGAIAVVLEGATRLVPAVSQGCRPIGASLVATKVDGNVVLEFRGQPAARALFEVLESLDVADRKAFQGGPFIGRAIDAAREPFSSGDLLVRAIMGVDPKRHAVAIADDGLRAGATLQLMVRDAPSATAELDSVLELAGLMSSGEAFGGLLFTCGGRGQGMFGRPHHDAAAIERTFGPGFPLAGFSANGEVGPIGGTPFLHTFTASAAFLAPRS